MNILKVLGLAFGAFGAFLAWAASVIHLSNFGYDIHFATISGILILAYFIRREAKESGLQMLGSWVIAPLVAFSLVSNFGLTLGAILIGVAFALRYVFPITEQQRLPQELHLEAN